MKHRLLLLILLVLNGLSSQLYSQIALSESEQQALRQLVRQHSLSINTMLSDFNQQKHIGVLSNELLSKGRLAFSAPDRIRWEYTEPEPYQVIFKNEMLYVNNAGKKEELRLASNRIFRSFNDLMINSIKGDMFDEENFDISYFKTQQAFLVRFVPLDKRLKKYISTFELYFLKDTGAVKQVKLIEPNEDFTLITFSNKQLNTILEESLFKQ